MQTTIIYITGVYDTLDLFTQELKNAFESMGYASFTYDARLEEVSKQALIECIGDGAKKDQRFFCVTFNNLGYNLSLPAGMTGNRDVFEAGHFSRHRRIKKSRFYGKRAKPLGNL